MALPALSSRSGSRGRGTSHRPMRLFFESKLTQASIVRFFAAQDHSGDPACAQTPRGVGLQMNLCICS